VNELIDQHQMQSRTDFEERAVGRLFARLALSYGDAWERYKSATGFEIGELAALWRDELRYCIARPLTIKHALDNLPPTLPSLPAFKALCASYRPPVPDAVLLPKKAPTQQERDAELAALAKVTAKAKENRIAANQEKLCAAYRKPVTHIQRKYFLQGCKTGVGPGANIMREQLKHLVDTNDSCVTGEMIALKNTLFGETKPIEMEIAA
jgi:hypothetical protein